jgi:hypothetical protein
MKMYMDENDILLVSKWFYRIVIIYEKNGNKTNKNKSN